MINTKMTNNDDIKQFKGSTMMILKQFKKVIMVLNKFHNDGTEEVFKKFHNYGTKTVL